MLRRVVEARTKKSGRPRRFGFGFAPFAEAFVEGLLLGGEGVGGVGGGGALAGVGFGVGRGRATQSKSAGVSPPPLGLALLAQGSVEMTTLFWARTIARSSSRWNRAPTILS